MAPAKMASSGHCGHREASGSERCLEQTTTKWTLITTGVGLALRVNPGSFFLFFFGHPLAHGVPGPGIRSEPRLCPNTAAAAIPDPLIHCAGPGIELASWCCRDAHDPAVPQRELPIIFLASGQGCVQLSPTPTSPAFCLILPLSSSTHISAESMSCQAPGITKDGQALELSGRKEKPREGA